MSPTTRSDNDIVDQTDQITGDHLHEFMIAYRQTPRKMATLFGVGFGAMKREIDKGANPIESRDICYLYRLYRAHPELIEPDKDYSISDFYRDIGGESTVSKTDFSLMLGKECTAASRYLKTGKESTSTALKVIIRMAMAIEGNPMMAFGLITRLYDAESHSRGIDPLAIRTWYPKPVVLKTPRKSRPSSASVLTKAVKAWNGKTKKPRKK